MLILRGPRKNLELTHDAEGWKAFLADPEKQWKDGRSAKMMAEAWEAAAPNLPSELTEAFSGTPFEAFDAILAIPEYQVDLPGGRAASQNDLFVLGRIDGELAVLMVEGKVDESFGPLLSEWLRNPSPGKLRRLAYLQERLGLEETPVDGLRYQLLHRTASPLIEAERLGARYAAMVVHSFSPTAAWFDDYQAFAQAMGAEGSRAKLERPPRAELPELWIGWMTGDTTSAVESGRSYPTVQERAESLPHFIAHADWGSNPKKRWMCVAELRTDGEYDLRAPEPVGDATTLIRRLQDRAQGGTVVAGFDFPIGAPIAWAERAGVRRFTALLPRLGHDEWKDFYSVASSPEEISLTRPFYPMRPGGTKQHHLTDALGVGDMTELLRACERPTEVRGAASPVFWTMGGKQVGKAALLGWREVLVPALNDPAIDVAVWPFDGDLDELVAERGVVIAETYPAEACVHLGMTPPGRGWSKRSQEGRARQSPAIFEWAASRPVVLTEQVRSQIKDGFGPSKDAEDPFDSLVGLLSMIEVVLGYRDAGAPATPAIRTVEGWILGQETAG